ncbi:hypothetical protein OR1_02720 [Geobacter sp. OR-1]|uniref:hypothetical protein n=1 Tax=Geobacter sp. OR-1 TaxID=1266765 RepID=UPI0005439322|nr:hypothetical protein [Geobacter sp. OR-1]GAM10431.1 hypothetical protein OR1_02720 [Geobacter sp. OR-1]
MDTNIWTQFDFPGDMAKAVQTADGFKSTFGHLATHPYNINDPERSWWWLFPTGKGYSNWPAYQCGKFVFYKPWGVNAIRTGLIFEKGVCKELASAFGSAKAKHFEMTDRWMWHSLLKSLRDNSLAQALDKIRERTGEGPEFTLSVTVPMDDKVLSDKDTVYRFRSAFKDRVIHVSTKQEEREIPGIEAVESLPAMADCLEAMHAGKGKMLWVDFIVGLDIPVGESGVTAPWTGTEVWDNLLEPFSPWIKTEFDQH